MTIPKPLEKTLSSQPELDCVNCGDRLSNNFSAVDAFQSFVNNAPTRIIVEDAIQEIYRLNNEPDFEFQDECVLCVHCCLLFSQIFGLFRLFEARQKPGSFLASCSSSDLLRNGNGGKKGNANLMEVQENEADQADDDFEGCESSDEVEENADERSLVAAESPRVNSPARHSDHDEDHSSQSGSEYAEQSESKNKTEAIFNNNAEGAELIFKCADCSEAFQRAVDLQTHRVSVHNLREDYKCAVCKNVFLSETEFRRHMFEHLKDAKSKSGIKCPVCHRAFPNRSALAKHKSLMHSFGPKKTLKQITKPQKTCVAKLSKTDVAKLPKTDVAKPPKADILKPPPKTDLAKPPETTIAKPPPKSDTAKPPETAIAKPPPKTDITECGLCGKTFGNVFLLRKHRVEVHIMGQPSESDHAQAQSVVLIGTDVETGHEKALPVDLRVLTCSDCLQQYDYAKSKSFVEHRRNMHPDAPTYQCHICHLTLANLGTFVKHYTRWHNSINSLTHLQPEIFHKCSHCNMEFDSLVTLAKHRKEDHEDVERPFKCPQCPQAYKNPRDFRYHVLHKHGDIPFPVCEECQKTFTSHRSYCSHMENLHSTKVLTRGNCRVAEKYNKVMFVCLECNMLEFPNQDDFSSHNLTFHNREVFECSQCPSPEFCRDKHSFNKHLETHEKNPSDISYEATTIPSASDLERHVPHEQVELPIVTPNDPLSSQINNKIDLNNTRIAKNPTKGIKSTDPKLMKFQCEVCKKKYSKMENLKTHRKRIHQMVKCEHCDYVSNFFKVHLHTRKVHKLMTVEKKLTGAHGRKNQESGVYKCADCDQGYNSIVALESHRTQIHPDKEKFKCPHCLNSYLNASHLRIHILSHDTDKDWPCGECSFRFLARASRDKHLELVHGIQKGNNDDLMPLPTEMAEQLLSEQSPPNNNALEGQHSSVQSQDAHSWVTESNDDDFMPLPAEMADHSLPEKASYELEGRHSPVFSVNSQERFKCYPPAYRKT